MEVATDIPDIYQEFRKLFNNLSDNTRMGLWGLPPIVKADDIKTLCSSMGDLAPGVYKKQKFGHRGEINSFFQFFSSCSKI